MKWKHATLLFAALIFITACGSDQPETSGTPEGNGGSGGQQEETMTEAAIEEQYAAGQYNLTEDGAADDQYEDATPEDLPFPLPPNADIIAAGQRGQDAYAVLANVPSGQEAYDFYLEALPDAGYEILSDNRANENQNTEGQNGEGRNGDEPFSAALVIEGNDLRGTMRFDEERVIVGISRAAVEDAAEAAAEAEERREDRQRRAAEREAEAQGAGETGGQNAEEAPER